MRRAIVAVITPRQSRRRGRAAPAAAAAAAGASAGATAAVTGAPPPMAQVAAPQLLGVYPNPINEGLGLAHHFVLGRWLEAGAPTVQGTLRAAAA